MRTSYDGEHHDPPAPVAWVTLQSPDGAKSQTDVPLLMDTGADVTLLPRWAIEALELPAEPEASYELAGFDGSTSVAVAVRLSLLWMGKTFRGQFLVIDQPQGILGRNILNNVSLLLDGPHREWELQTL
ncbi:retropepsin-like aspartic protease [Armatimonas sp.]|uniref:retropepsin-like aspartic protease n=1 Tax=Armatimonas sp. TaxID=1872638 RepID=UPI00286D0D2D|nr:retropepsin-like aspartic protease [Armatimonas sp.]